MPNETVQAVEWALSQEGVDIEQPWTFVDKVRQYFNDNSIQYSTFSFDDLTPFLIN